MRPQSQEVSCQHCVESTDMESPRKKETRKTKKHLEKAEKERPEISNSLLVESDQRCLRRETVEIVV